MVDFKNLAWATSFATQASRKFIYLPYRASGKKSYCHTLDHESGSLTTELSRSPMWLSGKAVTTQLSWILSPPVCRGAVGSVGRLWLHSWAGSSLHQYVGVLWAQWEIWPPSWAGSSLHQCVRALWALWEGCGYTAVLDPLSTSVSWGAVGSVGRLWLHSCAGSSSPVCLGVLLRLLDQHHMCHTSWACQDFKHDSKHGLRTISLFKNWAGFL